LKFVLEESFEHPVLYPSSLPARQAKVMCLVLWTV
jgi:hypothetical protein